MLWLYRRVIFGPLTKPDLQSILDVNIREIAVLTPLVLGALFFGVAPTPVLNVTEASVKNLLAGYQTAVAEYRAEQAATKLAIKNNLPLVGRSERAAFRVGDSRDVAPATLSLSPPGGGKVAEALSTKFAEAQH